MKKSFFSNRKRFSLLDSNEMKKERLAKLEKLEGKIRTRQKLSPEELADYSEIIRESAIE